MRELLVTLLSGSSGTLAVKRKKVQKKVGEEEGEEEKKKRKHLPGEMIQGIGKSREANKVGAISKGGRGGREGRVRVMEVV